MFNPRRQRPRRLFGIQPRADAARTRLRQSERPCLLEGFLVADPPLQQVVARTVEAGSARQCADRGRAARMEARGVPHRQQQRHHQGCERHSRPRRVSECRRDAAAGLRGERRDQIRAVVDAASYSLHRCDVPVHRRIASPNNPSADADGNIQITPGKHIPGIPQASVQGARRLRGDAGMDGRRQRHRWSAASTMSETTPIRTRSCRPTGSPTCTRAIR